MWWWYRVLNLNEERNVVFEDHISFLQSIGIKQTKKTICLMVFQQYFCYIVVVSVIGGGNRRTRRKSLTCCKSLTNFIT
jgi:hypothetical protein